MLAIHDQARTSHRGDRALIRGRSRWSRARLLGQPPGSLGSSGRIGRLQHVASGERVAQRTRANTLQRVSTARRERAFKGA
jgi:hypothetical protein